MRRAVPLIVGVLVAAAVAGGAYWLAKRKVRWNDARTMPPPLAAAVNSYRKGDAAAGEASVRTLLLRYRAPAWEPRARVLAATHHLRLGKLREILVVLPRDLAANDPLAGEAMLLRARGLLAAGSGEAAAELAARAAAAPGFPGADEARRVEAQALATGGKWREAISVLDAAATPAASIEAARIAASNGDREGARRRLVSMLLTAAGDDDLERAGEAVSELIPDASARFTAAERPTIAAKAARLLEEGRAATASALIRLPRPAGAPSTATPGEALIEAEALLKQGRTAELGPLLARARSGDAAAQMGARYLEARRAGAVGSFATYRAGLLAVAARAVAPWQERALLDLARSAEGVPSATTLAAYQRYRAAAGPHADPLAILREAWAAYDLKRFTEAEAGFSRALARRDAPTGVQVTATYWRARMAETAGRRAESRKLYGEVADTFGNHYYGALAAKRLGRRLPVAPSTMPKAGIAITPSLAAGRILVSVGLWDQAAPYYRAAMKRDAAGAAAIAEEAAEAAQNSAALSDAIGFAQDAVGDRERTLVTAVPLPLWRLLYPAGPAEALTRAARSQGLDPNLVAAVALQESVFNPLAVSSAGARGLLQIMPKVGAELAHALGMRRFDASDLFDPEINLRLGSKHLSDYRRRFESIPRGLAAFNGGPARVARWSGPAGMDDDERFVERIPIPETRLYVKRVLAGERMYAIAWPKGLGVD